MILEEFKKIKIGDVVVVNRYGRQFFETVQRAPYYNEDCDEPGWELETDVATYDIGSVDRLTGIKSYLLDTILADGPGETGGVSYRGETLEDFIDSCEFSLNTKIGDLLEAMSTCNIKFN